MWLHFINQKYFNYKLIKILIKQYISNHLMGFTMPGFVIVFTYKRTSHVDHSKHPEPPKQKIGQDFRAFRDIACTSRKVTDPTHTPTDRRKPQQRTLGVAMITLRGQTRKA